MIKQAFLKMHKIGPFPIARINFYKVYTAYVRIVSIISDKAHGDSDQGAKCLCFLAAMLSAADRLQGQ